MKDIHMNTETLLNYDTRVVSNIEMYQKWHKMKTPTTIVV